MYNNIGIIGTGASGIFTAIELINNGFDGANITMLEKGRTIDKRKCFVTADTPCKKCKICSITHGCCGAGSFSDSKLNFDTTGRVGGDMAELMTEEEITKYLKKTYEIYQQFGIEEFKSKTYGEEYTKEAIEIMQMIKENPRLDIGECHTIHLGSENSRIIYKRMLDFLKDNNVNIIPNCEVIDIIADDVSNEIWYKDSQNIKHLSCDKIIVAMGRSGNKLVKTICDNNSIKYKNGEVQIGVRVETTNDIMDKLNRNFYELKHILLVLLVIVVELFVLTQVDLLQ